MNKIYVLFYAAVIWSGCGSESDGFVGTWTLDSYRYNCPSSNESFSTQANNGCFMEDGIQNCVTIVLNADGTGTFTIAFGGSTDVSNFTYTSTDAGINVCDASNDCEFLSIADELLTLQFNEDDCVEEFVFKM